MSFRLDRFATLYLVNPLRRSASRNKPSIPILMYHSISDDAETGVHPYYRTSTSPQQFASQMKYLHENGYRTASLPEIVSQLQGKAGSRRKASGHHVRRRLPRLLSIRVSRVEPVRLQRDGFSTHCLYRRASNPVQREGLLNLGRSSGTEQSRNPFRIPHRDPPAASGTERSRHQVEIANSKATIEEKLGSAVDSFAYPYAFPSNRLRFHQDVA